MYHKTARMINDKLNGTKSNVMENSVPIRSHYSMRIFPVCSSMLFKDHELNKAEACYLKNHFKLQMNPQNVKTVMRTTMLLTNHLESLHQILHLGSL